MQPLIMLGVSFWIGWLYSLRSRRRKGGQASSALAVLGTPKLLVLTDVTHAQRQKAT